MLEKLQPLGEPNFSSLTPQQVRVSSIVEIGDKYLGKLDELGDLLRGPCQKCESCQKCNSCESCQRCQAYRSTMLDGDIDINSLSAGPIKIAKDVIYELIQEADVEKGECLLTQSRTIYEMSQEAYDQMPEKDRFIEIGTTESGTKQYLLRSESHKKIE